MCRKKRAGRLFRESAHTPEIGKIVDDAMTAIEKQNTRLARTTRAFANPQHLLKSKRTTISSPLGAMSGCPRRKMTASHLRKRWRTSLLSFPGFSQKEDGWRRK